MLFVLVVQLFLNILIQNHIFQELLDHQQVQMVHLQFKFQIIYQKV